MYSTHTNNEIATTHELIHDLINPLATISLLLETNTCTDPIITQSKNKIEAIMQTLSILLGKEHASPITESDILTICESLQAKAKRKNVSFLCMHTANISVSVPPKIFYRVLLNIISNAIDAYLETDTQNKIIITSEDTPNQTIIHIEDFGCGYSKNNKIQGTGLGLGIVRSHLSKIHASIKIRTKPTCGTIVSLYFTK